MNFTLRVWRQEEHEAPGRFETYEVAEIDSDESFLEMIDGLNDELIVAGERPIAFDHDCREGICGACSMTIDGHPHGPGAGTTTCQIYMRSFQRRGDDHRRAVPGHFVPGDPRPDRRPERA